MAGDVIPELLDQLTELPPETQAIDFLIVSEGGDPKVAWRAMSLLRERCKHISVLIPQVAFSAATLLALGADEIVMHPNANLGPVDPQVIVNRRRKDSDQVDSITFGYEDMVGFIEFLREKAGIKESGDIKDLFLQFCQEVGAIPVGLAARGSLLTTSMGEKLLRMHMKEPDDEKNAKEIALALNQKFFDHGYPVSRSEAKDINLKVAPPDEKLESLIWKVWQEIEDELKIRRPFHPIHELALRTSTSTLLGSVPHLELPSGLPPQAYQQILTQFFQANPLTLRTIESCDFKFVSAVLESCRSASRYVQEGKILATRSRLLKSRHFFAKQAEAGSRLRYPKRRRRLE